MKRFKIGNIDIIATRDPSTCTYLKWTLYEANTGLSLMPSSWEANWTADTLEHAKQLVKNKVIDKHGEKAILKRVQELQEVVN